jgi:hypothetical protein
MIVLPEEIQLKLIREKETGMGYHIGNAILNNDTIVEDVVIVGSAAIVEVRNHDDIPFNLEDIKDIIITHNKWNKTKDAIKRLMQEEEKEE